MLDLGECTIFRWGKSTKRPTGKSKKCVEWLAVPFSHVFLIRNSLD